MKITRYFSYYVVYILLKEQAENSEVYERNGNSQVSKMSVFLHKKIRSSKRSLDIYVKLRGKENKKKILTDHTHRSKA